MSHRVERSENDLNNQLNEQINFLKKSASEFDKGDLSEAKRLAVTLRILLHDGKKSKSILNILKLKSGIRFLDTAKKYNPNNFFSQPLLVSKNISSDGTTLQGAFKPFLNEYNKNPSYFAFNDWWEGIAIVDSKNKFKRSDIVLHVADTDGGAHIDEKLHEDYFHLSRKNSMGFSVVDRNANGEEKISELEYIELFTIRQITFEVISSMKKI